ncbi:hypothetical protein KCU81_g7195, partial [Aureobasidium melanogenum]
MASYHPNVGALRLPAPAAPAIQTIDLDLLPSDGVDAFCHHNDPDFAVVDPDTVAEDFRAAISRQADLQALFGGIPFKTRGLPLGYQAEHRLYDGRRETRIYGHPSGGYFKAWSRWGEHLTSLLKEDLVHCDCQLCRGWRQRAPPNAAINVGLPLVAGGAVAAALVATVARKEQRAREEEATQQSTQLLVQAADVEDLPEWQKAIINEALERIVGGTRPRR